MQHPRNVVDIHGLEALEERVSVARLRLQKTTERDPAFESRVRGLVELVKKRDKAVLGPFLPPAA